MRSLYPPRRPHANGLRNGGQRSDAAAMFWHLAERRIDDAVQRGLLDDLPGRGKPLQLDLYEDVPPELRAAYSILRAAGCLPEELERRRHRVRLEQLLAACVDDAAGADLRRQLLHARLAEAIAGERAHTH